MATYYGGYCATDDYRARLDTSATSGDTSYSITATCYLNSLYGYASNYPSSWSATANGSTSASSGNLSFGNGATTGALASKTVTVKRTHSAQTITCKATVSSYAGASTATGTVSVPALDSWKVTYNANGGSGAPSSQTKWRGESLKLSTTKPTRSGYDFLGWSTSSTAASPTSAYAPGATYSTNGALALYAVWSKSYIPPTVSSVKVYRSDSTGTASDDGTYVKVIVSWKVDTSKTSSNVGKTIKLRYKLVTATSYTDAVTASLSGTSGTYETVLDISGSTTDDSGGFLGDKSYHIQAEVIDNANGSSNKAATLSKAFFTLDFRKGGRGIGMGHSADVEGAVRIGMDVQLDSYQSGNYEHGNFSCVDNRLPASSSTANDTNSTWGNGLFFYGGGFNPNSGNPIYQSHGYVRGVNLSGGSRGVQMEAQRYVSGARKANSLNVTIDSTGIGHATLGGVGIFMTHGKVDQSISAAANSVTTYPSSGYVNFGRTYSSAPDVVVGFYSTSSAANFGGLTIAVSEVKADGFKVKIFNNTSNARSPGFYWIAIGD